MSKSNDQGFPFSRKPLGRSALNAALGVAVFVSILVLYSSLYSMSSTSDPSGWRLTWSDEFNGPNGSPVDPARWSFDIGGKGWGNNELETYTNAL